MHCPSRHRLLEKTGSAVGGSRCAEETPVIVGTGTPHPGIDNRGARYRMTVRPADLILLTRWVALAHVLKPESRAHSPSHACRECADLSVDVREVGQRRPPPHPHDGTVGGTAQFHGHGATGAEAV
jgi:hypothetical protein